MSESKGQLAFEERLQRMGYEVATHQELDAEQEDLTVPLLPMRLAAALSRINPEVRVGAIAQAASRLQRYLRGDDDEAPSRFHNAIVHGIQVGDGTSQRIVKVVEIDDLSLNELVVVCGTRLAEESGLRSSDFVCYINGLPLAVVTCTEPDDPAGEASARSQLTSLVADGPQALRGLFVAAQVIAVTDLRDRLWVMSSVPGGRWGNWGTVLQHESIGPAARRDADPDGPGSLLGQVLAPERLLPFVRDFVLWDRTGPVPTRLIARAWQVRAVQSVLDRVRAEGSTRPRGGIILHAQGSGRGLAVTWLVLHLLRESSRGRPIVLVLTDRAQMRDATVAELRTYVTPDVSVVEVAQNLVDMLQSDRTSVVVTTIQMFGRLEIDDAIHSKRPVFVLAPEAFRSLSGSLAERMRDALPDATYFGFATSPQLVQRRELLDAFGPLIYADDARCENDVETRCAIVYEQRTVSVRPTSMSRGVGRESVYDILIDAVEMASVTLSTSLATTLCNDIAAHYNEVVQPSMGKALVIAKDRRAALLLRDLLSQRGIQGAAALVSASSSGQPDSRADPAEARRDEILGRFFDDGDPLNLLAVTPQMTAGTNWPPLHAVYVAASLSVVSVSQVLASLERTAPGKDRGYFVDYWGLRDLVNVALQIVR